MFIWGDNFAKIWRNSPKQVCILVVDLLRTLYCSQPLSYIKSLLLPGDLGWVSSGPCLLKISCN